MPETTNPIDIQLIDNSAAGLLQTVQEASALSMEKFLITIFGSVLIGLIIAAAYGYHSRCSRGFLAMGAGLTAGMGQMLYALIFTVILHAVFLIGNHANLYRPSQSIHRTLNVTIPEDLDYTGIFDDLMQAYTSAHELVRVKTTNMGSMFRLTYRITLREAKLEKSLIDSIRCRNGNLEITVSNQETASSEL